MPRRRFCQASRGKAWIDVSRGESLNAPMQVAIAQPSLGPVPSGPASSGSASSGPAPAALLPRIAAGMGRVPPTALLLLAILCVQLGGALSTVLFSTIGPIGTAFLSAAFSAAVVTAVEWGRRHVGMGDAGAMAPVHALRKHGFLILLFGLDNALLALCYFLALQTIPLGIVATVTFLGPLGLAVATSRRLVHFLWIAIAAIGVALLTPDIGGSLAGHLDPIGLGYAAVAALTWAAFVPLTKRLGAAIPGNRGLALGLWAEVLLLLPVAIAARSFDTAGPLEILGAFGVSLLGVLAPLLLEYRALQTMSARTYGILLTLEPAAGALVGVLCLGQPAHARMMVAVGCVMLAALGVTLTDRSEAD